MYQQKLAKAVANFQRKTQDLIIEQLGTEQSLLRIQTQEDRYKDRQYTLISNETITGILVYPGSEIPTTFGTTNTDQSDVGIHLYDLLPIELYVKSSDQLNFGDIIIQKVRTNTNLPTINSDGFRLITLQIVDVISKYSVERIWSQYLASPYTLDIATDLPELGTIIDNYLAEPW